ncbi:MAG: esterase-like activity of phytase family protein [Ginsengibacter sp.]
MVNSEKKVLLNPSVSEVSALGKYIDTFEIPPQLHVQEIEKGPRQNGAFEGLDFTKNMKYLFVSVEEPLYNDGSRASIHDTSGIARIIKFDMRNKKPIAQYAYLLEPVAFEPVPKNAFKVNGISDILYLGNDHLLVIERSFSEGRMPCTIKIFEADLSTADNINEMESIKSKTAIKMIHKKLLLNMDDLGIYIDNIEGVTFGPVLPNGKRSLLFVSDDNFDPRAKTQILLFEIN